MEAGLPNITGTGSAIMHYGGAKKIGAISVTAQSNNMNCNPGGSWGGSVLLLNASDSNNIYGNSSTVTPNSLITNFYISY